jgi:hypothetical protein
MISNFGPLSAVSPDAVRQMRLSHTLYPFSPAVVFSVYWRLEGTTLFFDLVDWAAGPWVSAGAVSLVPWELGATSVFFTSPPKPWQGQSNGLLTQGLRLTLLVNGSPVIDLPHDMRAAIPPVPQQWYPGYRPSAFRVTYPPYLPPHTYYDDPWQTTSDHWGFPGLRRFFEMDGVLRNPRFSVNIAGMGTATIGVRAGRNPATAGCPYDYDAYHDLPFLSGDSPAVSLLAPPTAASAGISLLSGGGAPGSRYRVSCGHTGGTAPVQHAVYVQRRALGVWGADEPVATTTGAYADYTAARPLWKHGDGIRARVRAYNAAGGAWSAYSAALTLAYLAPTLAPENPSVGTAYGGQPVRLSWGGVPAQGWGSGVTGYLVRVSWNGAWATDWLDAGNAHELIWTVPSGSDGTMPLYFSVRAYFSVADGTLVVAGAGALADKLIGPEGLSAARTAFPTPRIWATRPLSVDAAPLRENFRPARLHAKLPDAPWAHDITRERIHVYE